MCDKDKYCEKPEKLKGKPKNCTPEQIKECHGDSKEHTCMPPVEDRVEDVSTSHSKET